MREQVVQNDASIRFLMMRLGALRRTTVQDIMLLQKSVVGR